MFINSKIVLMCFDQIQVLCCSLNALGRQGDFWNTIYDPLYFLSDVYKTNTQFANISEWYSLQISNIFAMTKGYMYIFWSLKPLFEK